MNKNNSVNEVYNKVINLLKTHIERNQQLEKNNPGLNKIEEDIHYLKQLKDIINDFIKQNQFISLKNLGFDYSKEIKDNFENPMWFFYHSQAKIFLAIEANGFIRYVSPYLEEKYVRNVNKYKYGSITSTKEYTDNNLTTKAIRESVDKIVNGLTDEVTEITIDDLPLLSMEEENDIRDQVYQKQSPSDKVKQNIEKLLQQDPSNPMYTALIDKSIQMQELTADEEISKRKQEIFNTLPDTMKEIITTNRKSK